MPVYGSPDGSDSESDDDDAVRKQALHAAVTDAFVTRQRGAGEWARIVRYAMRILPANMICFSM